MAGNLLVLGAREHAERDEAGKVEGIKRMPFWK
jgi:hypothetical protein